MIDEKDPHKKFKELLEEKKKHDPFLASVERLKEEEDGCEPRQPGLDSGEACSSFCRKQHDQEDNK